MSEEEEEKHSEEQPQEKDKNKEAKDALKSFLKDLMIAPIKPPDDTKDK